MNLALFDSLFLTGVCFEILAKRTQERWPSWALPYFPWVIYPLKYMLFYMPTYMVVVNSIERFQAIVYPLHHRPSCWPYVLFVTFVGVTASIPSMFVYELTHYKNGTVSGFTESDLISSKAYMLFFNANLLVIGTLGPFVCILFCNLKIFLTLKKSKALPSKEKKKSAKTLFFIVVVFLLAHSCVLINECFYLYYPGNADCNSIGKLDRPLIWHLFSALFYCMLSINSSCNFLIHCMTGSAFRQELKQLSSDIKKCIRLY